MNIWDVLEIEATSSARAIKRAYARQLTKHHPEDDPEGFQLVQAAYERALLIARGGKGASEDVSPALRRAGGRNHGTRSDGIRCGGACGIGARSGAVRR